MNCIILEDNKMERLALKQMLLQFNTINVIGECENPIEATNLLKKSKVDLILLDVEMPKMSGFEFLTTLKVNPLIILITAKKEYAVQAFEYNVVDYIVKPVKENRLTLALNRAEEIFKSTEKRFEISHPDFIFIREKGILSKIKTDEILYIQALSDYSIIRTSEKKFTIHLTLKALGKKLSKEKFMRIHRSYIAAINRIDSIEDNTAIIGKFLIPIGDVFRSSLLKKLNLLS